MHIIIHRVECNTKRYTTLHYSAVHYTKRFTTLHLYTVLMYLGTYADQKYVYLYMDTKEGRGGKEFWYVVVV